MNKKYIAPSLLSSDFADLKTEIAKVTEAGAHLLHVDVMDGHFVPNLTIGMPVVKAIKGVSKLPLDVHLMIDKPEKYIEEFAKAGSDFLTIHVESTTTVKDCLIQIRKLKMKPGITLRPKTKLDDIKPFLALIDLVLIMTVEPGFGGQEFMHDQLEKVSWLKSYRDKNKLSYLIQIDGGVNEQTAQLCWEAGADVLVAGSAIFSGEKTPENYRANIQKLL
ncbi:ribulose-phosphate 3-epimerase [Bdellovibrio sp. qaytius]|nr:ribulose-phosphate 3-epimerase [Bdellovibrio sp. qaytius]